jgi:hypothetical protein
VEPAIVARVTPDTGDVVLTFTLPAAVSRQCFAMVDHNIPDDGTVQLELFSDVLTTGVHDTGAVAIPDRTDDAQTFPILLDAALSVRSGRITITGLTDDFEAGGFEIAKFWEFPWITAGLDAALRVTGEETALVGGGSVGPDGEMPRTRRFDITWLDLDISVTTRLDLQKLKGLTRPFVYVEDYDTASSLPRDCFLATNAALPPAAAQMFDADSVSFEIEEHRR